MGKVLYKAARHHMPVEFEFESLDEAMRHAFWDVENNEAYPKEIIDDDNVFDREAMQKYWDERNWDKY